MDGVLIGLRKLMPTWPLVGNIVVMIGLLTGLGQLYAFVSGLFSPNSGNPSAELAVSVLVVAIFTFMVFREYSVSRKEKYANITSKQRSVSLTLQEACCALSGEPTDAVRKLFMAKLREALDDVSDIFSTITGTKCRVAVKVIADTAKPESYVVVLQRDKDSGKENSNSDKRRAEEKFDKISQNPHLRELFSESQDCKDYVVFSNIPSAIKSGAYISTSVQWARDNSPVANGGHPIGYRSAIIASIYNGDKVQLGFIGVDSESRGVFRGRWDGPLLSSIASQVAFALDSYRKFLSATEEALDA